MAIKARVKFGTVDGQALFVDLEVHEPGEGQCGNTDARCLSVTGDVYRSGRDMGGGQCIDMAREVLARGNLLIPRADAQAIVGIWDRWHMNDMQPGCQHQRDFGWTYNTHPSEPCPICGYKCGTAWQVEPLPEYVVAFIIHLAYPDGRADATPEPESPADSLGDRLQAENDAFLRRLGDQC